MTQKKLPRSVRKYIRKEKACIRREVLGLGEQEKQIQELCQKFLNIKKSLPAGRQEKTKERKEG